MKDLRILGAPSNGWLLLIGGGEFSFGETREFDEFLLSKLPADNRTIAFVPVASGSNEYAVHLGAWLRGIDPSVEVANVSGPAHCATQRTGSGRTSARRAATVQEFPQGELVGSHH